MILVPEDVGQDGVVVTLLDETHGDTGDRRARRHARIHEREAGAADRSHRARSIRLGDLGDHAHDVRKFIHIRQYRLHATAGQLAVADLTPFRRADETGLADAVRREVVVQHERLFALTFDRVDDLCVAPCTECRDDDRLRLAAGEYGRAMRSRQDSYLDVDRPDGLRVTTVDARFTGDHAAADDVLLEFGQRAVDRFGAPLRVFVAGQRINSGRLGIANRRLAVNLVGNPVGIRQATFRCRRDGCSKLLVFCGRFPVPCRLADFSRQLVDRIDRGLHGLVPEHDRTEHDLFGEHVGLGLDHQYRIFGAGNDEIEMGVSELRDSRVEDVVAVNVAHLGSADRPCKWHPRYRQRGRGADERRDVGIYVRVQGDHGCDHLHFVLEALWEERPDRSIDQAAGQRLFFARSAFTLEEATRDLARGVGLLLVIDGQREEIPSRIGRLATDGSDENGGFSHVDQHRAVCLARNGAGFNRYLVFPVLERFRN